MLETRFACPSCGAPLAFRPGTMVAACAYCKALSARTDRDPRLLGKAADLVATGSNLRLGMEGSFAGRGFQIVGRTQLRHPLGGVWDEWYLSFPNDRWGWLAEAQGHFLLTFKQSLTVPPPEAGSLQPGQSLDLGPHGTWTVAEVSEAEVGGAEGEIPWEVEPGATYAYADLSGRNGAFATLDFSETPAVLYPGRETSLADLQLRGGSSAQPPKVRTQGLPCPHCASPLTLQAPDLSQRVGCPSCGSLLDVKEGRLEFLRSLNQPEARIHIPLGTEGLLRGRKVVVTGFMVRVQDGKYPWREYLLLDLTTRAFLWLVESDGHWSLAEGIPAGEVTKYSERSASAQNTTFKGYTFYTGIVQGVWGEFYWKVNQGERADVVEFIEPPLLLAEETQVHDGRGGEVNWSLSTYLDPREVWSAFRLQGLPPRPEGIAPHMPNPHRGQTRQLWKWSGLGLLLWLLILGWQLATFRSELLYKGVFDLQEAAATVRAKAKLPGTPAEDKEVVLFSPPIQVLKAHRNLEVRIFAPVNNNWIEVDGALASQTSTEVELFQSTVSQYRGVDEGEAWSEGGTEDNTFLSAVTPGTYVLRLAPSWEGPVPPVKAMTVEIRSGVIHGLYHLLALLALLLPPLIQHCRVWAFEGRRWSDSIYSNQNEGDSDGDSE